MRFKPFSTVVLFTMLIGAGVVCSGFSFRAKSSDQKKEEASPLKRTIQSVVAEQLKGGLDNYLVVKTGVVESGSRIPMPVFADGTVAKASQCRFMVSPAAVNTVLQGWASSEGYYLVCQADADGLVRCYIAKWYDNDLHEVKDEAGQYHIKHLANYIVVAVRD